LLSVSKSVLQVQDIDAYAEVRYDN